MIKCHLGLDTADICIILSVMADGTLLNPMLIFKVRKVLKEL